MALGDRPGDPPDHRRRRMGSAGDGRGDRGRDRRAARAYDLILFGNESADAGNYQVAIRVASTLGLPCVNGIKAIAVEGDGAALRTGGRRRARRLRAARAGGGDGQGGLNLPRYPSVPGRMRAKRKPWSRSDPRAPTRLEMVRLTVPESQGKQTEVLGHGPEAAPAVVAVLASWAWCEDGPGVRRGGRGTSFRCRRRAGPGLGRGEVARARRWTAYAPAAWGQILAGWSQRAPRAMIAAGSTAATRCWPMPAAITDLPMAANCVSATPGDPTAVMRVRWGGSLLEEARLHAPCCSRWPRMPSLPSRHRRWEGRCGRSAHARRRPLVRVTERVPAADGGISLADAEWSCRGGAASAQPRAST